MNKNLRTALRFSAYIRAMGDEPIPFRHGSHREWALELQRQHESSRQTLDPEAAKAAKTAARALIRRRGYRRAAEETLPVRLSAFEAGKPRDNPGDADQEPATASDQTCAVFSPRERRETKRDEHVCRHKLRHTDHLSATLHALRLGNDVRVFECEVCDGLHVGHDPESPLTRQYRRARKRSRTIEKRLAELDNEWIALVRERSQLRRELGRPDGIAEMASEIIRYIRRLLRSL